jgi:hypothetical protein
MISPVSTMKQTTDLFPDNDARAGVYRTIDGGVTV